MADALFWLVYRDPVSVVIQPAHTLMAARLGAAVAGAPPVFAEGHQLDRRMAGKIPKDCIGRVLSQREAQELLKRLA